MPLRKVGRFKINQPPPANDDFLFMDGSAFVFMNGDQYDFN